MKKIALFFLLFTLLNNLYSQNYTVLGNASSQSGCNCYQLTPDANDMAGAIFQNQTINLNNSFDYTFSVFLGCRNGNDAADGIVFVLTNNPNGLGSGGGGLGYGGGNQPFSLAVEFDTYENSQDPSYDHIAIQSAGSVNHNVAGPVPALTNSGNIDNCQWYTVRIVWDVNSNTYSVYFNGVLRQNVTIPNMVGTYFGGNPIVNWGWTAGTGGGTNDQRVCVLNTSSWVAGVNYQSCSPTLQFSDISTSSLGSIQSWAWNFGDGTTSTQQNPLHTYAGNGTYTVTLTITDLAGCTNTFSHPVTINPPITLTPSQTPPPCNGGSNGSVGVTATGGFGVSAGYGGYRYDWNGGASTTATYGGIPAGTYTVSVTDGVCSATGQYTLNQPPTLSASTSHVDAPCTGNGSVTIAISGGTPPYTGVNWAGVPGTTVSFSPGTYIADFRDANGCSALLQYRETISALPCGITSSVSITNVTCFGGNNGSATLTVTGGVAPINITWSSGATGATAPNLAAGTYTYNYSDGFAGNAFSGTVTITQPGAAMVASLTAIDMACASSNDGQAIASVPSGGVPPYNYTWSGGQPNNATANNLSAGPISVTVTDSRGCTATALGSITGPPVFTLNITSVNDSCFQADLGSATANATGGNPPYTYYWSNISSAQTNLNMGAGTYTVTVTDTRGCTVTGTTTLNEPPALLRNITVQNINCNGGTTGSINLTPSGGTPGYTYTWNPGTASGSNPTNLASGTYRYTISDLNNCQFIDSANITQPATALSATSSHTNVTCNGANNGTITITIGGGTAPYTYQGNPVPAGTNTLPGLAAGPYSGTVTDANGCTVALSETITEPGPQSVTLNVTNSTCNGGNNGTATANFVNATGTVTYNWNPGGALPPSRTGLAPNTYSVTATDANSCTASASATITEPAVANLNVTAVDASCFAGNGTATASPVGTSPFTYTWSSNSVNNSTISLPAGNYTVTAVDAGFCNQTGSFTINEPLALTRTVTIQNINCNGASTGSINLTPSGGTPGYTYTWNPVTASGSNPTNLAAGTYRYTISDLNNCQLIDSANITEPATALSATSSHTDVTCNGANNGTITITIGGGTAPYTYQGNPVPAGTNTLPGLAAGLYSGTVTDANGCTVALSETITEPGPQSTTLNVTNVSCNGGNNGTATANFINATGTVTYNWNPGGALPATRNGLTANTYSVTTTDANSCTASASATITEPTAVVLNVTTIDPGCFGGTGTATANPVGSGPFNYTWSSNSVNNATNTLPAGNYTVTSSDANSCNQIGSFTISQPAGMTIQIQQTDVNCFNDNTGSIVITVSGGVGPNYQYNWNPNVTTSNIAASLAAGPYRVTITDQAGCPQDTLITITQPTAAVSVNVQSTNITCFGSNNGSITINAAGGTPQYNYTWNPNVSTSNSATGLTAGPYAITVRDVNNCSIATNVNLSSPQFPLTATTSQTDLLCFQVNTGTATINSSGGTFPYGYSWSPNVSTSSTAGSLASGVYNTTITDANGCTTTVSFNITEPTQLTVGEQHTNNLCSGDSNGDITLNANGGTPGYTYTWLPNVSSTNSATGLTSANYNITITDANNCTVLQSISITEPPVLNITATSTDVLCSGQNNGTITATVTGGTNPYTYNATIDGVNFISSNNGQFTSLADGTYTVLTSDNNQCTQSTIVTINNPGAINLTVNTTDASCYGYTDGQISASASGGNPGYTFSLSNNTSNSTGSFTGLAEDAYTLTVSDVNNCSVSASATINQPDSVSVTVSPSPVEVKLGESIQIRATTNQTSLVSYNWEPSFGLNCYDCANPTFSGNYSYTYTVTATNIAGCFATRDVLVTVNPVYDIFFPNVFTPNGDGANQLWNIFGNLQGIKQLNVKVFDRWGEKVFESNDINFGWDGTYKGKDAPVGVYTYIAEVVWLNNHSDSRYKGTVTLLR